MKGSWKKGLLKGMLGLLMVLGAAGFRHRMGEEQLPVSANSVAEQAETETETRKIALTFDDGPHPYYTDLLLDGLKERGVKATFFLLGENIEGREDVVKRMAEEGHLIGNHTFYHVDVHSLSEEEACREIRDTSEAISAITGIAVEYIRPPYGSWERELECEVMMIPVFWTLDTLDWKVRNRDRIVRETVEEAEENDIILMHDSYQETVEAALQIVDILTERGYEFVTADELILE